MIHLAALQVPFCRADPPLGARVNVLGTVNVFEAVKRRADRMAPVVYASSIAAFDARGARGGVDDRPSRDDLRRLQARQRVDRAGLLGRERRLERRPAAAHRLRRRPRPGRHLGADPRCSPPPPASPTRSPTAAAPSSSYARDVARAFIAASVAGPEGASIHNLRGRASGSTSRGGDRSPRPRAPARSTSPTLRLPFPERRRQRARSPRSCRASPRRRSATASRRPSTAFASSSPRGSSSHPP